MTPINAKKPGEEDFLRIVRKILNVEKETELNLAGTTDDASLLPISRLTTLLPSKWQLSSSAKDTLLVATQDGMIEGVHFTLSYMSSADAVCRCVLANISDLSAMGAVPLGALINIGLPKKLASEESIGRISQSLKRLSHRLSFTVLGGDLISAKALTVSVAMLGLVERTHVLRRRGAKVGDGLFLSDALGLSSLGLRILRTANKLSSDTKARFQSAIRRYIQPPIRIEFSRALALKGIATSCIDLSDSLSKSILLLSESSQVGFELWFEKDVLHPLVYSYHGAISQTQRRNLLLSAEEDFELLFTANENGISKLPPAFRKRVIKIGRAIPKKDGVFVAQNGKKVLIKEIGYRHF